MDQKGSATDPEILSHYSARALWHFTTTQRRAQLWKEFSDDATQGYFNDSLSALGRYMHTWQDHFSHGDRPPSTGQLQDCFKKGGCRGPDETFQDVPKADTMARTTFEKFVKAIGVYRGTQRGGPFSNFTAAVDYKSIAGLITQFNQASDLGTKKGLVGQILSTIASERQRLLREGIHRAYSLPSLEHDGAAEGMAIYLSRFEH